MDPQGPALHWHSFWDLPHRATYMPAALLTNQHAAVLHPGVDIPGMNLPDAREVARQGLALRADR
jgi:hypothetical protein